MSQAFDEHGQPMRPDSMIRTSASEIWRDFSIPPELEKLPIDVTIGNGTFRKGVSTSAVLQRLMRQLEYNKHPVEVEEFSTEFIKQGKAALSALVSTCTPWFIPDVNKIKRQNPVVRRHKMLFNAYGFNRLGIPRTRDLRRCLERV